MGRNRINIDVDEICRLGAEGFTQIEIARRLGISQGSITNTLARRGVKWKRGIATQKHYVCIQIWEDGKLLRAQDGVTPEQLRTLADYMESI